MVVIVAICFFKHLRFILRGVVIIISSSILCEENQFSFHSRKIKFRQKVGARFYLKMINGGLAWNFTLIF